MFQLIQNFPSEITHAYEIARSSKLNAASGPIHQVVISGVGGSGIGGSIVSAILQEQLQVPVMVNRSYFLPAFTNENTLVIISSYSGNTEETLHAFEMARAKKAHVVCVCSGGKVAELAEKHNSDIILIPSGRPPRASLGYSMTQLFHILEFHKLIPAGILDTLVEAAKFVSLHQEEIKKQSFAMAELLKDLLPVIYSDDHLEAIAIRWKQQMNENAKMLCWHNVYPELNHNELVGWRGSREKLAVVMLTHGNEFERIRLRMKLNEKVFMASTGHVYHIEACGHIFIEKAMYLLHYGDWLSYYLAEMRGFDPMEIDVLNDLKSALSQIA